MAQASLDEYLETEEEGSEGVENREEEYEEEAEVGEENIREEDNVSAFIRDPEHKSRCRYCNEWVGRLHGGSIYLYVKNGRLTALADIDHVYQDCKHGLMENLRFLRKLVAYLRARGYKILAVGKAYDDDLYAWIHGEGRDLEYRGLRVAVFKAPETAEDLERWSYGLQRVEDEAVREVLEKILE